MTTFLAALDKYGCVSQRAAAVEHPLQALRRALLNDFPQGLPVGLHPIRGWCADPQCFPGATGMLRVETWTEVQPGC